MIETWELLGDLLSQRILQRVEKVQEGKSKGKYYQRDQSRPAVTTAASAMNTNYHDQQLQLRQLIN